MAEVVAETDRLLLRTWADKDERRFFEAMNTPAVMRWLGGLQTFEQWRAAYQRLLAYDREFGFTFWLLERKEDSQVIGFCGLKRANAPGADLIAGDFEIGWRLREDTWGDGYAREAAISSLDLAFNRFGAPYVRAVTARGNLPSQGLMKRLGMTRREEFDFIDQRFPADSDVNPQIVFSIVASEWPFARSVAQAGQTSASWKSKQAS
jgi:RimJ/RimL family protein N-acetyltransferase